MYTCMYTCMLLGTELLGYSDVLKSVFTALYVGVLYIISDPV